ncbi:MAG: hypothetical protein R3240_03980 [Gammaproteobacteria bacterium]|nr:hypothetical protein [Gammaproteobacteria bacterium]
MIKVENGLYKKYGERWSRQFENSFGLGPVGKAYLRSITEAKSLHVYKSWWRLAFKCRMADKIQAAALSVNDKLGFANMSTVKPMLDPRYWSKDGSGDFVCKTKKHFAKAVNAIFTDNAVNALECKGLSQVMALRSVQLALGDNRFDLVLQKFLGKTQLKIPLDAITDKHLVVTEDLSADGKTTIYTGDGVYRPGDMIAVSNMRHEALGTQWLVENGICVGWKGAADGHAQYNEPLFVGGGVPNKVMTEAQIREYVYQATPSKDKITGDRKGHFAEKALGKIRCQHKLDKRYNTGPDKGKLMYGLNVVPDTYLHTTVIRLNLLGGRTDIII